MVKLLWGLRYGPDAIEYLTKMRPSKQRGQISKKARKLIANPYPQGCKKLVGFQSEGKDVWRLRAGDYRILYTVGDQEVVVIDIGNRKDVYR